MYILYMLSKFHSRDRLQNYWTIHLIWIFLATSHSAKILENYLEFHDLVFHYNIETVIFKDVRTRKITIQLRFHAQHSAVSSVLFKEANQSSHMLFMSHSPTQLMSIIFIFQWKKNLFSSWYWNYFD